MPTRPYLPASRCTIQKRGGEIQDRGITAALTITEYSTPSVSAMMKATAPITGGMICPPIEAVASTPAANARR